MFFKTLLGAMLPAGGIAAPTSGETPGLLGVVQSWADALMALLRL